MLTSSFPASTVCTHFNASISHISSVEESNGVNGKHKMFTAQQISIEVKISDFFVRVHRLPRCLMLAFGKAVIGAGILR